MEEKFNTEYAQKYTGDTDHGVDDMKAAWWELFSNYRAKKWRNELKALVDRAGYRVSICMQVYRPGTL